MITTVSYTLLVILAIVPRLPEICGSHRGAVEVSSDFNYIPEDLSFRIVSALANVTVVDLNLA